MRPAPTWRGWGVVAVAVAAFALGHVFGGRSLNAVVMPAVALLAVSAASALRAEIPTVERRVAHHGFVEGALRVELDVVADRPVTTALRDRVPDGLHGDAAFETVADGRTLAYELHLDRRGVHELGPVDVVVTDLFGLWERRATVGDADEVVVFPRVRSLYESTGLLSGYVGLTEDREQFDSIREYEQGDALRDVNWKASAKRNGELVVTEFAGEGATNTVTVGVAPTAARRADAAAEAAASVAIHLLEAGVAVGVVTPKRTLGPGTGEDHRRNVLTLLARYTGLGPAVDDEAVDIVVRAGRGEGAVQVESPDSVHHFGSLVAEDAGEEVVA